MNNRTAIFIYKPEQVPMLATLIARVPAGNAYDIFACNLEIEFLLEEKKILFRSAKELRTFTPSECLLTAKKLAEDVFQGPVFTSFTYRGISLSQLFTPILRYYFGRFLYVCDIAISALENEQYTQVIVFAPADDTEPFSGAVLEAFNARVFFDAVSMVCHTHGLSLEAVHFKNTSTLSRFRAWSVFILKRMLFGWYLTVLNAFVRTTVPHKNIRILGSEHWKNLAPLLHELPDSELILLDRIESLQIGWRAIKRYRMQFLHGADFTGRKTKEIAQKVSRGFIQAWEEKQNVQVSFRGYDLHHVLDPVMRKILKTSMEVVIHIEGTFTMMESLKPHVLIVRASISAQWHFAMLCEVARNLGIPSIEIQHGVFSVSEDSLSTDHAAEFIAEYGPIERELWHAHQYAPRSRAIDIGSPRFDAYHSKNGLKREEPLTVLHIAPQLTPGEWIDSYEVFTFFKTMADAAREIPGIHVIIKLRAGDSDSTFFHNVIKRTFGGVSHEIASREPLLTLLDRADIVVSCHSTAVHEALAARRPVILDTTLTMHKRLVPIDFGPHIKEGAVLFADGSAELSELLKRLSNPNEREALSKRAAQFMEKNYLFSDGKSSLRLADAIRDLVKSKNNLKPLLF